MSGPGAEDFAGAEALAAALLERLFPICRSITGEGFRQTLDILGETIPWERLSFPTGTPVFDWTIPREWTIRDAFIKDGNGNRVVDFQANNLHVVSYSTPVHTTITLDELRPHLHTLPQQPDAIPYRTNYYRESWGFCLSQRQLDALAPGRYEVCIDSTLSDGELVCAEAVLPGQSQREVLLSSYCCHPSMANNELSGPIVQALLYRWLSARPHRRFTYRFYLGPETIGAIAYLTKRGEHLREHLHGGLVLTCCGDGGAFTYKTTRRGNAPMDAAAMHALSTGGVPHEVVPFFPGGSDERQFCSPGFDLPVGSLLRSMYGRYPQYHTSLDDLSLVSAPQLVETLRVAASILCALETDRRYRALKPHGEPFLSKYGLYDTLGGGHPTEVKRARQFLLNFSDGEHTLLGIAHMCGQSPEQLLPVAEELVAAGLLAVAPD